MKLLPSPQSPCLSLLRERSTISPCRLHKLECALRGTRRAPQPLPSVYTDTAQRSRVDTKAPASTGHRSCRGTTGESAPLDALMLHPRLNGTVASSIASSDRSMFRFSNCSRDFLKCLGCSPHTGLRFFRGIQRQKLAFLVMTLA